MSKFKPFQFVSFLVFIFFYLINPKFAISEIETQDLFANLENTLNEKKLNQLSNFFNEDNLLLIQKQFLDINEDFQNLEWEITNKNTEEKDNFITVKLTGTKLVNGEKFYLESNFDYYFQLINGKISDGIIKNDLTTIRNDKDYIDINIDIPNKVLSGSNYYLDIIINPPLGSEIYAGGLMAHNENNLFDQNIVLEPLLAGGIFKTTRASSQPGYQVWTGVIAHKEGIISFTKTVEITDEL